MEIIIDYYYGRYRKQSSHTGLRVSGEYTIIKYNMFIHTRGYSSETDAARCERVTSRFMFY